MSKPFDLELYSQDDKAKLLVIDWMKSYGIETYVNPDQYGIDLLGTGPKGKYQIEVEVKHNWSGPTFPFDTVHFAGRKQKFVVNHERCKFVMLNHDLTHALMVDGTILAAAKIVNKRTIYTASENFIEVPISSCKIWRLDALGVKYP